MLKRLYVGVLATALLVCLAGCGAMTPDSVSSAPSTTTSATTTTLATETTTHTTNSSSATTTTTVNPTVRAQTMRLTVLTSHLTAKTEHEGDGSRYLISLNVADYAPGTILKVTYDGRITMSYPAQIVTQHIEDTGETDQALTLLKGEIADGSLDESYAFQPDEGGERIYFQNRVQVLQLGTRGTLCLYDNGDRDDIPEGYFYTDD